VLGVDFDAGKLALARRFGAEVANPGAGEDPSRWPANSREAGASTP
jgi:hypothetical protein